MKIGNSAENTLVTNVDQQSRGKFKIQATGKAFSILSNSLYQHKVKAVVREIGCNAYDAHIDAKNTATPFDVTLPTINDPNFTVRDYGIGLHPDMFVEVYTTYFGSSKADSNDHTGGLGLGSKTPFIMSKSFTVHSFYEGTEYMWHSFVNDNGEPDVMMLHSKPTTEHNGLKVIVPIGQGMSESEKTALFREFGQEAEIIYQWFDVVPNVTADGVPVKIESKLHGPDTTYASLKLRGADEVTVYYSAAQEKVAQGSAIYVKMGNVVYPYDLKEVRNLDRFGGNIVQTERVINYITKTGRLNPSGKNKGLVLDVGMGDVDIAPSREALSLNNTTELTIINTVVRFVDLFLNKVQEQIDNATTIYDKYQALYLTPPLGGKLFTIDGKEVDPAATLPAWRFTRGPDLVADINAKSHLRVHDVDDIMVKYRRPGTRALQPMTTAFSMTMYGADTKNRTIILMDAPHKGELRGWVNANTVEGSPVVVIFGEELKNGRFVGRPLTAAEMVPFLADSHPQVVKFSQLKHAPVVATRSNANSVAAAKATMEDALRLEYTSTSCNIFTTGNSTALPIATIKKQHDNHKDNPRPTVYIAFRKAGNTITAELANTTPPVITAPGVASVPEPLMLVDIANWSRSNSRYTTWCSGVEFLSLLFRTTPDRLDVTDFKANIAGVDRRIAVANKTQPKIQYIALTKEAYAEVVDSADYPMVFSLDRAIRELVIPAMPQSTTSYECTESNETVAGFGQDQVIHKFMKAMGWTNTIKLQQHLHSLFQEEKAVGVSKFKNDSWVQTYGYDKLLKSTSVMVTYSFPNGFISGMVRSALANKIPGAQSLYDWLADTGADYSQYLGTGYYQNKEKTVAMFLKWSRLAMERDGYDAGVMDNFFIEYIENSKVIS